MTCNGFLSGGGEDPYDQMMRLASNDIETA
jgi:hypothetical protein